MRGDVVHSVYGIHKGRETDTYFGTFRTVADAEAAIARLRSSQCGEFSRPQRVNQRVTNGDSVEAGSCYVFSQSSMRQPATFNVNWILNNVKIEKWPLWICRFSNQIVTNGKKGVAIGLKAVTVCRTGKS